MYLTGIDLVRIVLSVGLGVLMAWVTVQAVPSGGLAAVAAVLLMPGFACLLYRVRLPGANGRRLSCCAVATAVGCSAAAAYLLVAAIAGPIAGGASDVIALLFTGGLALLTWLGLTAVGAALLCLPLARWGL